MPIGFDPNDTVPITLDCFPKRDPPAEFHFRFLTAAQTKRVEKLRAEAGTAPTDAQADKLLNEAILLGLAGWKNVKDSGGADVPFSPEALEEFTIRLKFKITQEYPYKLTLTDAEKNA